MKNNQLNFELIMISTWFIGVMAVKFMLPALPTIAMELNTSTTLVKYMISLFLFGKAFGMLFFGPLSERYGRKIFMLTGLGLFAFGNILAFFADTIWPLLLARFIQGLGTSATVLMGRAMVNDHYKNSQAASVFSHVFLAASIVICFLPMIGSLIVEHFSWRYAFLVMSSYSFIILVLALFFLNESKPQDSQFEFNLKKIILYYKTVLSHPVFLGYVLCSIFMIGGESAFNTASSFLLMKSFQLSTSFFGMLMSTLALGHLIGTILCGRLVKHYQLSDIMGIGVIILASSTVFMAVCVQLGFENIPILIFPMVIFYIGTGFVMTMTAVGAVLPFPNLIGISSAASLLLNFCFSASSSALMSHMSTQTPKPVSVLIAVFGVLSLLSWYYLILPRQKIIEIKKEGEINPAV